MSFTPNRLLDDLSKLMVDAAGAAQGVSREAQAIVRTQVERLLRDADVASREEVEVLQERVAQLEHRLDLLEKKDDHKQEDVK